MGLSWDIFSVKAPKQFFILLLLWDIIAYPYGAAVKRHGIMGTC